jgi:DNA-binding response OmpR family regulator
MEAVEGTKGLSIALSDPVDMLLLDIMLPGMNGYEICRKVKIEKPELPVIMLTARGAEMDKIAGLDIGADDYLTKPFSIPELLARIRALFRRYDRKSDPPVEYTFGNITLNFSKYQAFKENTEIRLSAKEFDILEYFVQHKGEVIHRHKLLDEVWGYDVVPTTRTVDNFILDLRKKIEDNPSKPIYITSVRGIGYRFNG